MRYLAETAIRSRLRWGWWPSGGLLGLVAAISACGGTEPGNLFLSLDAVPEATSDSSIVITGIVARTPPAQTAITVSASGGVQAASDTTAADGRFTLLVSLLANTLNTLTLTAQDASGSTSDMVEVKIFQDAMPPMVVSMTPQGDGIGTTGVVIEVQVSEPVVLAGASAGLVLSSGSRSISGVSVLSNDSLTLSFFPDAALTQNTVYQTQFIDVTDVAGNPVDPGTDACFITELTLPAQFVLDDPTVEDGTDSLLINGDTTEASIADITEERFAVEGGVFTGVFEFTTPRSFDATAVNNVFLMIEIDTDQDTTTGVQTLKDSLLFFDPLVDSGIRADYLVGLEAFTLGDSAYVGRYLEVLPDGTAAPFGTFELLETFIPAFCGNFIGFATDLNNFGADDGNMNLISLAFNVFGVVGVAVDLAPTSGHVTLDFAGKFTPPTAAPARLRTRRTARVRIPLLPPR